MNQLKNHIIEPVLQDLGLHSKSAVNLLIGVVSVESNWGEYIKQLGSGPACGIFQMEPATRKDIYDNFLKYKPDLLKKLNQFVVPDLDLDYQLICNLAYATALARIHFYRVYDPLPVSNDLDALANYWKDHYNTYKGAGIVQDFKNKYPEEFLNE